MVEGTTYLYEILPDGLLRNKTILLLEVLQKKIHVLRGSLRNSKTKFHDFSMIFHDQQCNFHDYLKYNLPF